MKTLGEPLAMTAFLDGRWKAGLDRVAAKPPAPLRPRTDGAAVAAAMIRSKWRMGGSPSSELSVAQPRGYRPIQTEPQSVSK